MGSKCRFKYNFSFLKWHVAALHPKRERSGGHSPALSDGPAGARSLRASGTKEFLELIKQGSKGPEPPLAKWIFSGTWIDQTGINIEHCSIYIIEKAGGDSSRVYITWTFGAPWAKKQGACHVCQDSMERNPPTMTLFGWLVRADWDSFARVSTKWTFGQMIEVPCFSKSLMVEMQRNLRNSQDISDLLIRFKEDRFIRERESNW